MEKVFRIDLEVAVSECSLLVEVVIFSALSSFKCVSEHKKFVSVTA